MIPTHITERVFRIFHGGRTATAYTVDKDGQQFLVSASHVFDGSDSVDEVKIFHARQWKNCNVSVCYNSFEVGDTIIFQLENKIAPISRTDFGPNFVLGGWAYFLGFPLDFGGDAREINNRYPMPFIKAALISNFYTDREGLVEIYLDGHNNKGFSGGPVVVESLDKGREFNIMGTVSGYITEPVRNEEGGAESYQVNAGIIQAYSIKNLMDTI